MNQQKTSQIWLAFEALKRFLSLLINAVGYLDDQDAELTFYGNISMFHRYHVKSLGFWPKRKQGLRKLDKFVDLGDSKDDSWLP